MCVYVCVSACVLRDNCSPTSAANFTKAGKVLCSQCWYLAPVGGGGVGRGRAGFIPSTNRTQIPQHPFHPEACTAPWAWELRTEDGLLQAGKRLSEGGR